MLSMLTVLFPPEAPNVIATRRLSSPMKRSPRVVSTSPVMHRTSVDLPEPDRPMMTKISPLRMSSVASRTAGISP